MDCNARARGEAYIGLGDLVVVRTERYVVRPFLGLESADAALKDVRLVVNGETYESGSVVLSDEDLTQAEISVLLPSDGEALRKSLEESQVPEVDCGLVVLATAANLRASVLLLEKSLNLDDFPETLQINRHLAPLVLANKSGFKITVAIVLLHQLQPQHLRPRLAGTWLARRDFRITPERDDSVFDPAPLTDEMRAYHRLPKGTLSFIDVSKSVISCESLADEIKVYLDEDTLNTLLRNPSDPLSRQIQAELAATTLNVVAVTMIRAVEEEAGFVSVTESDLAEHSRAADFFKTLASRLGHDVGTVISMAQEPDRLRAEIQSAFGLRGLTERALREG